MSIGTQKLIIAGLFTIFGAIVNALIVKYGLPSISKKKARTIKGKGYGKDINISDKSSLFSKINTDKYQLNNIVVTIEGKYINIKAKVISTKPDENFEMEGHIKGKGSYVDGIGYLIMKGHMITQI